MAAAKKAKVAKAAKTAKAVKTAPPAKRKPVTKVPAGKNLKQNVVIRAGAETRRTGAQRIAPDHSPRAKVAAVKAPRALASAASGRGDLQRRVEQFLYAQSELLDNKYWQDYINLFATDGVYWMPVTTEQIDWEGQPSIFAEDKLLMQVRMGRITHPNAWSQAPMWATNHVVSNVVIEKETAKEVVVRSRFHMMELRRDNLRHFGGTYRHTLVKKGEGFAIKLQRVDMFNSQATYDYVLQIWV